MELKVKTLKVEIEGTEILHGIDLVLGDKKLTGIIGPNGSGKSTLIKTFYKAMKPSHGSVLYGDEDVGDMPQKRCARIASVLPQHRNGATDLAVFDLVLMGRYPHKGFMDSMDHRDEKRTTDALELLDLAKFSDRKFASLSGGEKQLVLLARALVQDTPWLLLDEPTNHLDIRHQLRLLDILKDLDKKIVVVFHDLSLASKYCDHLVVMKSGMVVKEGHPSDIVTPALIREVYDIDAEVIPHPRGGRPVVLL
ncbi:MAG: ABC transporter ATP-binding protein [Deltaproteobacteria bacterium]|jgi:iron complex transport system ATP-binding protein|nr:ABC transporter ATP-binding protein [Deltaproteobacteria bacterium]